MTDITEALAQMVEVITPVLEAGIGMRTRLERDGWTPESAEAIAKEFVMMTFTQLRKT